MINNENIKVVLEVAHLGSFQKAADTLGYTHAGISYIVNSIESTLGVRLFHRKHGGVELTSDGASLLPWMNQLANSEASLVERAREIRNLSSGTIRIATFNSASVTILPDIVQKFHRDFPGINMEFVFTEDDDKMRNLVETGDVDCAFLMSDAAGDLESFPVMKTPLVIMIDENHPMAGRDSFPISELERYRFIKSSFKDEIIDSFLRKYNLNPEIAFAVSNDYCAMAFASKGLGYCIYPKLIVENVRFPLVCLEFDEPQYWDICFATRSPETCSEATLTFLKYVREAAENQNYANTSCTRIM